MASDANTLAPPWWNSGDADPYLGDGPQGEHFEQSWAVLRLLADDEIFVSSTSRAGAEQPDVATLVVICNDLFCWGCADGEPLPWKEIRTLYEMYVADPRWGTQRWCCRHRKLRPQAPIVDAMKAAGAWDEELEALPAPEPS